MSSSSAPSNQVWNLVQKPHGDLKDADFKLETTPVPTIVDGQILVRALWISVDPYLRGAIASRPLNAPVVSGLVGEVIESKAAGYKVGENVRFYGAWERIQAVTVAVAEQQQDLSKVSVPEGTRLSAALGVLGMPGATAYVGLKRAASFKKGDAVVVTGAAGAVGSVVGQLAREWGASKVVGVAGGPDKCKLVKEKFGFDECIDYKKFTTQQAIKDELKRIQPDGFDVFFENTGGFVSDAIYDGNLRKFARVALCGNIANYNNTQAALIPNPFVNCIYTSIRVQGFIWSDYRDDEYENYKKEQTKLVKEGKMKYEETVVEGFEAVPKALMGLFKGQNTGKMVVKV